MPFQNFDKEKFLNFRNISFNLVKLINLELYNHIIVLIFNDFWDNYDLSLLISVKAFLPSLRVLKTSQESKVIIRIISIIREISVVSLLIVNILKIFLNL